MTAWYVLTRSDCENGGWTKPVPVAVQWDRERAEMMAKESSTAKCRWEVVPVLPATREEGKSWGQAIMDRLNDEHGKRVHPVT